MMRHCSDCGGRVRRRVPSGESRRREICTACGRIHYRNPVVVVGCIAEHEGRVLLCRRARAPRAGAWSFPVGFTERRETVELAVRREVVEETGAEVRVGALFSVFDLPHMSQLYVVFRGALRAPRLAPGEECSDPRLFAPCDIPWRRLTYPLIGNILRRYLAERDEGRFALCVGSVRAGTELPLAGEPVAARSRPAPANLHDRPGARAT